MKEIFALLIFIALFNPAHAQDLCTVLVTNPSQLERNTCSRPATHSLEAT